MNDSKRKSSKILSVILTVALFLSLMPVSAYTSALEAQIGQL